MRYLKTLIATAIVFSLLAVPVCAINLDAELTKVKNNAQAELKTAEKEALGFFYLNGSVYITTADITAEDLSETLGGNWQEINSAFLWATDGSQDYEEDTSADGTDSDFTIDPLNHINGRGGTTYYNLVAGVGVDDENMAFWTGNSSAYVESHVTRSITGTSSTLSDSSFGIKVNQLDNDINEIIPPYTVVKMFERI